MAEAGVAVKGVGDEAEKASQRSNAALGSLSNTAGLLGLALVAAAGAAVMAFANFDQSMSAVQAATHESAANMGLLRDAALEAGKRTVFSATEAAGAVEELAKAGLTTADILGGALNGALDLASAGALSVTEAAGTMSVALAQFKLPGTDASHVADLLAAGAGKAMGSVSDLGMALRQAGQVANSTGLTIEETTAGLSAFASAGLIGSDAGTSFKSMLQRLTPQSAEAQAKMDELGISAYDAQGNFIGLANFAGNLQGALKDLTPEQRNAAEATIFGSDAVRAANVLYDEGAAGISEWITKVDDSGYAAETAGIRLDNLKGDLEQLSGSVETAMIGLGEGADGPLRTLTQGVTELVNQFAELPPGVQGATTAIIGGGGLALLGVAGIGKLTIAVSEGIASFKALSTAAKVTGGIAAGAFAIGTLGLMAWATQAAEARARTDAIAETLDKVTGAIGENTREVVASQLAAKTGWWILEKDSVFNSAEKIGLGLDIVTDAALGSTGAMAQVEAAITAGNEAIQAGQWGEYSASIGQAELGADDFASASMNLRERLAEQNGELGGAHDTTVQAADAQGDLAGGYDVTTESIEAQIPTLEDLISLQAEAAGVVLSERDAQRAFQSAIDDATAALETNGQTLDIGTEAGRANQAALDDIAKSGWDVIESMRANGALQPELQAAMQVSRDAFVNMAIAEGMGADEANRLADAAGLIPAKVGVTVDVDTSLAEARLAAFRARLNIPDVVISADLRNTSGYYANRAGGGLLTGPGTSTSDSIPVLASNREYIVKAASVDHYGVSFFDSLNAMRFASGGYVGGVSSAAPAPVAPALTFDYRRLAREIAKVQITLDGRALNQSVDERLGGMIR